MIWLYGLAGIALWAVIRILCACITGLVTGMRDATRDQLRRIRDQRREG